MKSKNSYWIIAGVLNLFTFFLHLIGGQMDLIDPMLATTLPIEKGAQLVGAWHMVTIILLATSYVFLNAGFNRKYALNKELILFCAILNLAFCLPFIGAGFYYGFLVPQWILFLPIGVFAMLGLRRKGSGIPS